MAAKISVLGPPLSYLRYLRSAQGRFPLFFQHYIKNTTHNCSQLLFEVGNAIFFIQNQDLNLQKKNKNKILHT